MEQLHKLEKRVLDIIQRNKEIQQEYSKLKTENRLLQEQCKQLEASLMNQSNSARTLETEKADIKTTIEDLLETINSLDASK